MQFIIRFLCYTVFLLLVMEVETAEFRYAHDQITTWSNTVEDRDELIGWTDHEVMPVKLVWKFKIPKGNEAEKIRNKAVLWNLLALAISFMIERLARYPLGEQPIRYAIILVAVSLLTTSFFGMDSLGSADFNTEVFPIDIWWTPKNPQAVIQANFVRAAQGYFLLIGLMYGVGTSVVLHLTRKR